MALCLLYYTRFKATFEQVPPALVFQRASANQAVLTWDDWVLQSSFDLTNWLDATNATSPLTVDLAEAPARFWRLTSQ